jgi:hypothetical protein
LYAANFLSSKTLPCPSCILSRDIVLVLFLDDVLSSSFCFVGCSSFSDFGCPSSPEFELGFLPGFLDGSYKAVQGLFFPRIRSVKSIPAMVPCVIPFPESPVAI